MSEALHTTTFATPDAGLWGAIIDGPGGRLAVLACGSRAALLQPGEIVEPEEGTWELSLDGGRLRIAADGPTGSNDAIEQPVRVTGTLTLDAGDVEIEACGRHGIHAVPDSSIGSWRDVSAWYEGHGVAVHATRRARASGHSGEQLTAAVFDPEDSAVHVAEARLSTTYAAGGRPARVGLELWLGEQDGDQYPLRVAGEAASAGVPTAWGEFALQVVPLRCHARGREGSGIYVLAIRR